MKIFAKLDYILAISEVTVYIDQAIVKKFYLLLFSWFTSLRRNLKTNKHSDIKLET